MASKEKSSKYISIVLLFLAGVLLFFAQSAYWVNHSVFNQENFSEITTSSLLSESSKDAIADHIVSKSLNDRPLIKKTVGERAESLISSLLGSDLSSQAVTTLSKKTYAYATASNREDIKIDLSSIKTPIENILSLAQNNNITVPSTQYQIPDEIILVESDTFPDLSGTVRLMLWLAPLLWLSVIILFSLYIYIGRSVYARRVYTVGLFIIVVSLIGLLSSPFIPPPLAASVPAIELRPVAENLAAAFLAPFKTQMYYTIGFSLLILLVFNQRFNILAIVRKLETKLNEKSRPKSKSK